MKEKLELENWGKKKRHLTEEELKKKKKKKKGKANHKKDVP